MNATETTVPHVPVGAAGAKRFVCGGGGGRRSPVLNYLILGCTVFTTNILFGEPPLDLMKNQVAYLAPQLQGDQPQKPVMGCELSDFGSWYDIAYSGGIDRFM